MHVGIIPDGSRRWARERGLSVKEGHLKGAKALEKIIRHAITSWSVDEMSVYSLSTENLRKRSRDELEGIFEIQSKYFDRFARDPTVHSEEVRGIVLGFRELLPDKVLRAVERMEEATAGYSHHLVNFLMPYGGRQEIVRAAQSMIHSPCGPLTSPNPRSSFEENLFVKNPVDLVIRTSEKRMSNFLLYQTAHAEYVFVDKYWPSFTVEDFDECLEEYSKRIRRRGK